MAATYKKIATNDESKGKRPVAHAFATRSAFVLSRTALIGICSLIFSLCGIFLSASHRAPGLLPTDIACGEVGFPGKFIPGARQYHHNLGSSSLSSTSEKTSNQSSQSCKSREQQLCFWNSYYSPSPEFLSALRAYENHHAECVNGHPLTELVQNASTPPGCSYLLYRDLDGKGNQLISLVSAFVYAMLTGRVLLITRNAHIHELMCEPFPASSWVLPEDFPDDNIRDATEMHGVFYDRALNLSRAGKSLDDIDVPGILLAFLANFQTRADLRFFCSGEQKLLARVPWLFFRSNQYSIPGMYFVPAFRAKLNQWFPDRAVFLHVGRYLLSPEDEIWENVLDVYNSHMAKSDRRLAIQVRAWGNKFNPIVSQHILECALYTGLLPNKSASALQDGNHGQSRSDNGVAATRSSSGVGKRSRLILRSKNQESVSVLVTSLRGKYADKLAEEFAGDDPIARKVSIFTPSSEGEQKTGLLGSYDPSHEKKVIAEMWLLSFADDMISTPKSTFAFVAHGLAGVTPVVFHHFELSKESVPNPPCWRTNLPGPCFMDHPENMECPLDDPSTIIRAGEATVPEVRQCDLQWGVGLVEETKGGGTS